MLSLTNRIDQNELMDDASIGFEEFQQTLSEIEEINKVTNAYKPTLKAIKRFAKKWQATHTSNEPLRILDIGFGNGDFLRCIHTWAKKNNIKVELAGVDLNPWAERAALALMPDEAEIRYFTSNVFDFAPEQPYHIVINSLFTHHLTNEDIIRVLQWMTKNALCGWVINDLHRHFIPYFFIHYYVRFFGFNRLVCNDAPLSVARSFRRRDWEHLINQANLTRDKVKISWHWPFRYGVFYDR